MVLRDSLKAQTELDKLAALEPDEDMIEYIKTLVAAGDKRHVEVHMAALESDYPALDTTAARAAL